MKWSGITTSEAKDALEVMTTATATHNKRIKDCRSFIDCSQLKQSFKRRAAPMNSEHHPQQTEALFFSGATRHRILVMKVMVITALMAMLPVAAFAQTISFGSPTNFPVAQGPEGIALGDLNRDGKLDLVTANQLAPPSNAVTVRLGNGDGTFGARTDFALGPPVPVPRDVVLADLNRDGTLDIITADTQSDDIAVLLGSGGGGFAPPTKFATGTNPRSVAVGHFNGDGILDVVTADNGSNQVTASTAIIAVPAHVGRFGITQCRWVGA